MSIWTDALPVIAAAFADEESVTYRGAQVVGPISAVVMDEAASEFDGPGATLRRFTYEIQKAALAVAGVPFSPSKKAKLEHRGRRWGIEDITSRDDVAAWHLIVSDEGALP